MRRLPVCLALVLAASSGAAILAATDVNLSVPIFGRNMSSDLWNDVDSQAGFGATVDFGRHGSPFHFQAGLQSSTATKSFTDPLVSDTRGAISEIFFGIAKVWETKGRTRPYIGGGASFVHATLEKNVLSGGDSVSKDDDSLGFYVEGGVYWRLTAHFDFGVMGRYLGATSISLFGKDGDADYWEAGPMLGWSWPPRAR
jgi:hypothetical protein